MRWKIIIVNAGIVIIVGLLSFVLLYRGLKEVVASQTERKAEVERAIRSANAQLELDALRLERWLAEHAATEEVRAVFSGGTAEARTEQASARANRIHEAAVGEPGFAKMAPSLVLFVDERGVALGRNGSTLMRGDKMADVYPSLETSLKTGHTGSDVWLNRQREEQMLVSYAPVHSEEGELVGALILGSPLNDERLTRTSALTSGRPLVLGVKGQADAVEIIAKSDQASSEALRVVQSQPVLQAASATLGSRNLAIVAGTSVDFLVGAAPLAGYGAGSNAALIAPIPASLVDSLAGVLWPVFAVAALGVLLVIAGGMALGNYISQPISEMEDGLLQIINGRTDLRFQIEHPDLGGLVFRINSLLNALMGVPETDEEGRTSVAPSNPYQE